MRTELLLPECLESQSFAKKSSYVPIGNFPSEVRTSKHDLPLIAVMIIGMSKDWHCCQWEMRLLILFWVRIWEGILSTAGFQRPGKQHAKHSSHFWLLHLRLDYKIPLVVLLIPSIHQDSRIHDSRSWESFLLKIGFWKCLVGMTKRFYALGFQLMFVFFSYYDLKEKTKI